MAKRDLIAEITDKRSRLKKRSSRWDQVANRIDGLIDISNFIRDSTKSAVPFKAEMAKYLPIGFVACIEGYFRLVFRDLIDHGEPFRGRLSKFKDIHFGIEHVVAIQNGQVTLGEFVSHLLPTNGLDDLNYSMSILIGSPFLDAVKSAKVPYYPEEPPFSLEDEGLSDFVMKDMMLLFEQRHLFAHELTAKVKVNVRDTNRCSKMALIFIFATESILESLMTKPT